jgi:glycosyltransferase involved in cell wall biosynthesis
LTAGRLAPVKGQHILLDAVAGLVERERKNIELHIAGDGPDRKGLEEHASKLGIQDKVVFEGFVNQDQLRELYQKSDVFVLPSFAEGLPVVLMEAMALGVPCVSTWVNGVPELIRDGIDGYTVAPGDSAALADAIERLMSDEGRRESLARAGRQRAEEVVDLSKNVGQLAALFEKYLTAKARDNRVLASTIASH